MTNADKEALTYLRGRFKKGEWFTQWSENNIKRANYRLRRLADQGELESRTLIDPDLPLDLAIIIAEPEYSLTS